MVKTAKNIQELSYVFTFFTTVSNAKTHLLARDKPLKAKQEKIPQTLTDLRKSHPPLPSLADKNLLDLELPDKNRLR